MYTAIGLCGCLCGPHAGRTLPYCRLWQGHARCGPSRGPAQRLLPQSAGEQNMNVYRAKCNMQ